MWWITIIIDIILIFICSQFCKKYYSKHYASGIGSFSLSFLHTHETLHGRVFGVMPNFANYSLNIVLKGVVTIVCILVVHFTDSLWLTYMYIPYLILTYWTFKTRLQHYKSQPTSTQSHIKPALTASSIIPIFHTISLLLLYVTFLLN